MPYFQTQFVLDAIGHCRFSTFIHTEKQNKTLIDLIGRLTLCIFAVLSLYDSTYKSLPIALQIVVHGTWLAIISCLALSLILKRMTPAQEQQTISEMPAMTSLSLVPSAPKKVTGQVAQTAPDVLKTEPPTLKPIKYTDVRNFVKRNLLADFNRTG